jgi:hypothetical protein
LVLGVGGLGLRRFGGEFCVGIRVGSAGTEALEFLALGSNGLRGTETLVNTGINEMSSGSLTDTEPKINTCINQIQRMQNKKLDPIESRYGIRLGLLVAGDRFELSIYGL